MRFCFTGDIGALKKRFRSVLGKTWVQFGLFVLLTYVLFVNNVATVLKTPDTFITPINVTLIASFVVFCLEMAANSWTAYKQDYLYMSMELIGTMSILLEVSWIADWLDLNDSIDTENVSKTAIITSRAGPSISLQNVT